MSAARVVSVVFLGLVLVILFSLSAVVVDETEYAVILRFGQIVRVVKTAGLTFKTPFVDSVVKFDKRINIYDIPPEKIITKDKKTLVVDSFVLWRISDPKRFIETMRSVNLALSRIDDVVYSGLRNTLAKLDMDTIVTQERAFLRDVLTFSQSNLSDFGIEVVDVRVKRTDLPTENRNAVFERMKSERQSIAALIRAEGEKEAQRIRSEADKRAAIITAQAVGEAERIKGTGEASAARIYAEAYSKDPEFFRFWKTLESYRTFVPGSVIVLDRNAEILNYFK